MPLLDLIIICFVIGWLGGWRLGYGGNLIHLLIVVALVALVYRLVTGRNVAP